MNNKNGKQDVNLFDREQWDKFIENFGKKFNETLEKEIRFQFEKLKVEYKRDSQDAINTGITAKAEEKAKDFICPRIPKWMSPDMLTVIGILGVLMIVAGFILGFFERNYLILVIVGLVVNWFGDSFDGSIARYRKRTRPNYGYYIDHIIDAVVMILFGLGLGLSGFVKIEIGLLFTAMYLALMLHVDMVTHVQNKFKYSFGLFGPTEVRILGAFVTVYMCLAPIKYFEIYGHFLTQYDLIYFGVSAILAGILVVSIITKGVELDRIDRAKWVK
jgi:phosphatidylglycerophosphate synthase